MSRGNATFIPDSTGVVVTFTTRDGGEMTYHYSGSDAAAIMGGDDPKNYLADDNYGHSSAIAELADVGEAGEAALDISEGIADIGIITGF